MNNPEYISVDQLAKKYLPSNIEKLIPDVELEVKEFDFEIEANQLNLRTRINGLSLMTYFLTGLSLLINVILGIIIVAK